MLFLFAPPKIEEHGTKLIYLGIDPLLILTALCLPVMRFKIWRGICLRKISSWHYLFFSSAVYRRCSNESYPVSSNPIVANRRLNVSWINRIA
jgi:hypothetical protein